MIGYRRAGVDDGAPRVGLGSRVLVELVDGQGEVEALRLAIVPDDNADFKRGYLGAGTRLAGAIMGREAGETVPYRHGGLVEVRILEIEPFAVSEAPDAAGARRAVIQQAVDKSELQDTLRLALAVSVKWGDYDPDGIAPEEGPSEE
jgi:Transcription elongation factor, GreA/GreB, C-term